MTHIELPVADLNDFVRKGLKTPRHVVTMLDFSRPAIEHYFAIASRLKTAPHDVRSKLASGRCMTVMFYQQSTRTRLSFEAAMLRLGGHVTGFADPTTTRAVGFYEETLEDVVRFAAAMTDLVVLRHTETGAAQRAASVSPVPIINAGDGYGEHPTQALGDLYHMFQHFGRLDGLTIGIVGHLGWRAHRSLVIGLSLYEVRLVMLEPPGMTIPSDLADLLNQRGIPWESAEDIDAVLRTADVVTTLGIYHANFRADFGDEKLLTARQAAPTPANYRISADAVSLLDRFVPIMHMGPIADHIDRRLDLLPQAHYFQQARDGVWMRAALLASMLLAS